MSETRSPDLPSPFVERCLQLLTSSAAGGARRGRALDVAAGGGRHTRLLAEAGWELFAVDADLDGLRRAVVRAAPLRLRAWCADLTVYPLPVDRFELIVVTRYLQRDLFPSLQNALTANGVMIYETFTTIQGPRTRGPSSPAYLLTPGELRDRFAGFDVLLYEEVTEPDAYARICARRPVHAAR